MVSTDAIIHPYEGEPWGFDNGAWHCFINNKPFNSKKFLKRVGKMELIGAPILAVTPDILKAGNKSLAFSNSWIEKLQNGWPWYLAVQDGMVFDDVESSLTKYPYEGIFLGGGDSFKNFYGKQYLALARKYGLGFHFGRCGTAKKIRKAYQWGVDSCDSAFPHWVERRLKIVLDEISFQENMSKNGLLLFYSETK
jgi:hypothetical protein